ncbi:MAG: hypothetical protein R2867_10525 [Caldilineaceae bacterium]
MVQQADGVRVLRRKTMGSIPQHQGHLLTDRASWESQYKPRLNPEVGNRLPTDWATRLTVAGSQPRGDPRAARRQPLWLAAQLMGVENISYLLYDDPALFEEMVTTVADCILGTLAQALTTAAAAGVQFDACGMWEDMAYRWSPDQPAPLQEVSRPHYRRITDCCAAMASTLSGLTVMVILRCSCPIGLMPALTACSRWKSAPGAAIRCNIAGNMAKICS